MSNRLVGANGAGIRLVDTQGRPVSANRIGANSSSGRSTNPLGLNGAGIRKTVCPTCGKPLGANGAGVRIPSDSLTPRRLVGANGAGIRKI